MSRDYNILQELNEISPIVASIPKNTPYSIVEGYFESSRMELFSRSASNNPYKVTDHYFDTFPTGLLQTLENELETSSTSIHLLTKNIPYHLPENYFSAFEAKLMKQLPKQEPKNVVRYLNNWRIWSAAACLIGLIGLTLFFSWNKGTRNEEWELSWKEAQSIMEKGAVEEEFNQIKPEELVSFLSEQGHDVDAAVMACVAEESEHDEEWLYLQNEKEIETFLEESNHFLN